MNIELNTPLTDEEHKAADEEHLRRTMNNKRALREIADKLESGESLNSFQRAFAAAALRHVALNMSTARPGASDKRAKLPGDLAVRYALSIVQGTGSNKTIEKLAEDFAVSTTAVRKKLKELDYKSVLKWIRESSNQ